MKRFFQYMLRTLEVEAARAFYTSVLGDHERIIFPLHESALARGARPHWLGFLQVDDVGGASSTFAARGATPLGPKWINSEGLEAAVMRDPGGAVVALAKPSIDAASKPPSGFGAEVGWHLLHTHDVEQAKRNYAELAGWDFLEPIDLGSLGVFHPFAWEEGRVAVGAFSDIAGREGVHPHWQFQVEVPDFERAVARVNEGGGSVVATVDVPGGARIADCDDSQGAAFALRIR